VRLGLLWAASGAVLALGAQLRPRLPLSGSALFHVGVLLVPVSAAATVVGLGSTWAGGLLAAGLVGAPVAASSGGGTTHRCWGLRPSSWSAWVSPG
jgi:hypothetical protein